MNGLLTLKLIAVVVSAALAGGILARDHGLKANRLIAAFLVCNAYWAFCEFGLYQMTDPQDAVWAYRAMSLGWIPLGVLCAHASVTLSAMEHHPATRLIPACYVAIALLLPLAMGTNWVVVSAEKTLLGWRPIFGPGMGFAYLLMLAPLVGVLACWRDLLRLARSGGQLLLARIVFFGISTALVMGTITAIVLPILEVESFGMTTTFVSGVGLGVAYTLNRFGHSLISPDAFAREILDTLDDGVILVGQGGALRDANDAFFRMIGMSEADAVGRPLSEWIPEFSSTDSSPGAARASTLKRLHQSNGDRLPIVLSAPIDCVGGGRRVAQAFLVRDRREIVALQQQLVLSGRLAAVGDLTKSISRSINEPVARVREELEGLALDWQTTEDIVQLAALDDDCREALVEGHELIAECVEGIERICSIVREVTGFAGDKEPEDFTPHRLDQIVHRAIRIAEVQAPPGLRIETRLDPEAIILCHFAEIERVVTNLLVNAMHALEGRRGGPGHLTVRVAKRDSRVSLQVEDDGCGIESESLERIFDPFFTTKPVGKGTGLGLAISYHTVRLHGGEIRVSSTPGQGTRFDIEFPGADGGDRTR